MSFNERSRCGTQGGFDDGDRRRSGGAQGAISRHQRGRAKEGGREYGGISSTVVKTDDGVMIINMWGNEEGRHRIGDDPEIRQAIQDAGLPPPSAKGYEVLEHRTVESVSA